MESILYALFFAAGAVAAAAIAGFHAGRHAGYIDGMRKSDEGNNGWQEEALWWRRNATAVADRDHRQHGG